MTYQEALSHVNSRLRFGSQPGLARIGALLDALGNPQKDLQFIHVAGTNGKGTACALMAAALTASGMKTGLYTSPYVLDFRERFQIDGEMISPDALAKAVERLHPVAQKLEIQGAPITEFEFITALAFLWFREQGCEVVVLEVGLGGRFDATNIIDVPSVAVIMSVSLDHTAVLGNTVEEIAFEKAGIIKSGGTVVLYPVQEQGARTVIEKVCRERGAKLVVPEIETLTIQEASVFGTKFQVGDVVLETPFSGAHQVLNALTAFTALTVLAEKNKKLSPNTIGEGFLQAKMPARMEVLSREPLVLLDGGHNPGCAKAIKALLDSFVPERKKIAVIGIMQDKDVETTMSILAPLFDEIITTAPDMPRALSPEKLAEKAGTYCGTVYPAESVEAAAKQALDRLDGKTVLVVCGSFYLAGEIRGIILKNLK